MGQIKKKSGDLPQIVKNVSFFMDASRSDQTKRAYEADWRAFTAFCQDNNLSQMPADPPTICVYITKLAMDGKTVATIMRHLTTISQAHISQRRSSPTTDYDVVQCLKGVRRTLGTAQRRAKPLLWADLVKVSKSIPSTTIGKRDRALLLIGWAGAMRRSEIVALNFEDVERVAEGIILTIRSSKTDKNGDGFQLGIPYAKDKKCCPAGALIELMDLEKQTNTVEGPIFFALGPAGKAYFMKHGENRRLSGKSVNLIIAKRLRSAGIDPDGYSGHSLRSGHITSASQKNVPEKIIQIHTRHASLKILRGYIRNGSFFENNPLSMIF